MTFRLTAPSLTAAAALLAFHPAALLAQEATTEQPAATDATTATEGTATDGTATGEEATTGAGAETATSEGAVADPAATADGAAAATDATAADAVAPEATTADTAADATASSDAAADAPAASADGTAPGEVATGEAAQPSPDMQAVLDKLVEVGSDPIGTLPPEEQRQEPTPADAVMAVMEERGIAPDPALEAVATREVTYPDAGGGEQPIRVYTPEGEGPFPLIVYFHGGGWVIADIDTYDASARALAAGTGAVVASVEYRKGPESPFPAAHDDANAAYAWLIENSGSLNADAERVAVAGESAGGNLAINVAITARDLQLTTPDHMLLVYPVAGDDMTTPSYEAYADAQPLSKQAMMWFVEHAFEDPSQAADPRIDLVAREDLAGLPPATVINAEIDPLQSEGEVLAANLGAAGVEVAQMTYPSVTHEFFGMGAVVPTAKEAMDMATGALREALAAAQ